MKYLSLILLNLLFLSGLSARGQAGNPGPAAPVAAQLSSPDDTLQYSLGVFVGQWLQDNGFVITNGTLFGRGVEDVLGNRERSIPAEKIESIVASYQLSNQIQKNREMERQLFASLKDQKGVGILPSGVHYIVIKTGTGKRPMPSDTITMHVTGVFPDGTVFEDTRQKDKPIVTTPAALIPGLGEVVQIMPAGSVWRVFVPSALAYGPGGLEGVIPGEMALVFEVEF